MNPRSAGQVREALDLFEVKAAGWPAKYRPGGPLVGRLTSLSDAAGRHVQPGGSVLDLGCGTGELARALADRGFLAAGCDISWQMLRRAAAERGGCAGWVRLEPAWRRLPFDSAVFDAVVAASVLEYVAEPVTVFLELARVLRSGGVVLCTVPDLRHPVRWLEQPAQLLAGLIPVLAGLIPLRAGLLPLRAGLLPLRAAADGSARWQRYLAYLRASRQRHRVGWWLAAAESAGLSPVRSPGRAARSPLRLLVLRGRTKEGGFDGIR